MADTISVADTAALESPAKAIRTLEDKLNAAGDAVKMLRELPPYSYPFTYRMEYTSWADEQYAWKHAATMFDQSHHMHEVYFSGPDLKDLFSEISVNSFKNFSAGAAKQIVCCNDDGLVIGDTVLCAFEDNRWSMCGVPTVAEWAIHVAEKRGYDVTYTHDEPTVWNRKGRQTFRFQLNGPMSHRVLEAAMKAPVERVKFFHMIRVNIAGAELFALNHTMSGVPGDEMTGFELIGKLPDKERVHDALVEAGREFGLREGGGRAYLSAGSESGWIPLYVPAIYTGTDLKPFREQLSSYSAAASTPLTGSFASPTIEDYYLDPWDLGYGRFIRFDHDFIGRSALERMAERPRRRKVFLRWNDDDASRLIAGGLFGQDGRSKPVDFPSVAYGTTIYDSVSSAGRNVGFSTWGSYTVNIGSIITLGMVENGVADGDEVEIEWGEAAGPDIRPFAMPGKPATVRATVSSKPPLVGGHG